MTNPWRSTSVLSVSCALGLACSDAPAAGASDVDEDVEVGLPDVPRDGEGGDTADLGELGDGSGVDAPDVEPGGACDDDRDCPIGVCVDLGGRDSEGFCALPCTDDRGCREDEACILLVNSGGDAQSVCVPIDYCADRDGDGFGVGPGCLGVDCDDSDEATNIGADEICDGNDNDCDGRVDEAVFGVGARCTTPYPGRCAAGVVTCTAGLESCDQVEDAVAEVCNGIDDDCDGEVDEGASDVDQWYPDADEDGYGDASATPVTGCAMPRGHVARAGDCDDGASSINPGAVEVCDGVDNNCRDGVDEPAAVDARAWFADTDGDGFGDPADTLRACTQPEGHVADDTDCAPGDSAVNPDAPEVCDGIDNNCRDGIDEASASDARTWYADLDGDGYGDPASSVRACAQPAGYVADNTDCAPGDSAVNPGATEVCDGVDNNCRDGIDEGVRTNWYVDADGDGYGDSATVVAACTNPGGRVTRGGDCDDRNPRRNPGLAEVCDGLDNDCDGVVQTIDRRGRTVEYMPGCQNFGGGNANDLCFGEAWNGQGYMHCHYHASWDAALAVCQARGMSLTDIDSDEENTAVLGAFEGQDGESWDDLWLGGRENGTDRHFAWVRSGTVFWANGSTGEYTRWRSGEPSNDSGGGTGDCLSARQSDTRWNDRPCGGTIEFICEW